MNRINIASAAITLTFDKGNLSEEAFEFIDREDFDYIASIRPSTQKDLLSISPKVFSLYNLPNGNQIGVKEFKREIYGIKRRIIAIYNPKQAKWLKENFEVKIDDKIDAIKEFFQNRLNNKRWLRAEKIRDKCEKILGSKKFKNVVKVDIVGEEGYLNLSIVRNKAAFEEYVLSLGKSFLMTSRTDLEPLEIAWAYRQQYIVENAFKLLKNPKFLSIRPMFHRIDSSVRGHIFVCFIGLLLLSLLVRDLVKKNIPLSIPKAIKTLKKIKITKLTIPGRQKSVIKVDKMDEQAKILYKALNLEQFV